MSSTWRSPYARHGRNRRPCRPVQLRHHGARRAQCRHGAFTSVVDHPIERLVVAKCHDPLHRPHADAERARCVRAPLRPPRDERCRSSPSALAQHDVAPLRAGRKHYWVGRLDAQDISINSSTARPAAAPWSARKPPRIAPQRDLRGSRGMSCRRVSWTLPQVHEASTSPLARDLADHIGPSLVASTSGIARGGPARVETPASALVISWVDRCALRRGDQKSVVFGRRTIDAAAQSHGTC